MLLSVRDLKKTFDAQVVLQSVSFDLHKGESLGIIGVSGSGKSVLIKCIIGLLRKDSGIMRYEDQEIEGLCFQPEIRYSMLFQSGALFDGMTVCENVGFHLLSNEKRPYLKVRHDVIEVLNAVGLEHEIADLYPASLSGGMKKRVALARAIISKPQIVFFDEPTTGLDPITSHTINQLIRDTVKKIGAAAITITHDMMSLKSIADRVAFLHKGTIVWEGDVKAMAEAKVPELQQFLHASTLSESA